MTASTIARRLRSFTFRRRYGEEGAMSVLPDVYSLGPRRDLTVQPDIDTRFLHCTTRHVK